MRAFPPFLVFAGLLGGVLVVSVSTIAGPGDWLGLMSPRVKAEDAVAQVGLLPYQMSETRGVSPFEDEGCPMSAIMGWRDLVESPGAWTSFQWLLIHSAHPAGRVLALAGLQSLDSARFRRDRWVLFRTARLPDSLEALLGRGAAIGKAPLAMISADSVRRAVENGSIGRDLREVELPPVGSCGRAG